jgi:hypothetical protein
VSEERLKKLEKIRADVLQVLLLDELAGRLSDLQGTMTEVLQTLKETIPLGIVEEIPSFTISGAKLQQIKPVTPYVSFSLYNYGDNTVYGRVNDRGANAHPIEADDTWKVDMKVPKIHCIYLSCNEGESATVDVTAIR